jgi:hypothetical protein
VYESVDGSREQVLAELRRRMTTVGPGKDRLGAPLRAPRVEPEEPVVGAGLAPVESSERPTVLPTTLPTESAGAGFEVLAAPEALASVLPRGGLPKGGVVSLAGGSGTTSLLLALLAAPPGAWSAVVGMPAIGVLAAAEFGVDLDRLALIPDPGPDVLQVLSVLVDGVDLVAVAAPDGGFGSPARLRVLTGRLRQHGAVLLVAGGWPGADLVLRTRTTGWTGIGQGSGRLRDRSMEIDVRGRGAAGQGRSVSVLLRSDRLGVQLLPQLPVAAPVQVPVAQERAV